MPSKKRNRNRRGGVSVTNRNGVLRLRWRYRGKQKSLSLRIPETPNNWEIANRKAAQIEADIIAGTYDESLDRYHIIPSAPRYPSVSAVELFDAFTAEKVADGVSGQTVSTKYVALRSNIKRFGDVFTVPDAKALVNRLRDRQSPLIANQNLVLLKTFGRWLVDNRHLSDNPFKGIKPLKGARAVKVQDRTPFTREELAQFLSTMLLHPTASHYYAFTLVLFSLGLRPSEAIGLRWGHVDLTRRCVTISESLSRSASGKSSGKARQRKGTKTDNVRVLPLGKQLHELFTQLQPPGAQKDELIFTAAEGGPIDDHNYRERYWKVICEAACIPYRPPYVARHTLLTYGLEYEGWTYKQAAAVAGHTTTRMIEETYGHLMEMPNMPDMG